MAKTSAKIDFSANDDLSSTRELLRRLTGACDSPNVTSFDIELTKCQYLGPDAVSCLIAFLLCAERRGQRFEVLFPAGPRELQAFCEYSGLSDVAAGGGYGNRDFDPSHNVLRARVVRSASFRDADPVIDLVKAHSQISNDAEEYLRVCVNEVLQNIQDHSKSEIGGVMSARFMQAKGEVRVSIVDRGQGICTTLSQVHKDTTRENALRRVMGGRYSSLSKENNAGLGINHLKSLVVTLGGELYIISEESSARVRGGQTWFEDAPFRFGGTGVFFTLPMHHD